MANRRHLAACFFGFLECLLYGGLKYGWASLVFVLKDLHYFTDPDGSEDENGVSLNSSFPLENENASTNCGITTPPIGQNGSNAEGSFWLCSNQDSCLHLIFTIASVANGIIIIPAGVLVDRCSIRIHRLIFSLLLLSGLLMLGLSSPDTNTLLFPSMAGICMGGLILIISNVQIGNLFISKRSTVIALFSGAIDSSGTILLIVKLYYEYYGVTLRTSCAVLLGIAILLFAINTLLLPRHRIVWPPPSREDETTDDAKMSATPKNTNGVHFEVPKTHVTTREKSIRLSEKHKEDTEYPSVARAVLSPLYILLVIWLSLLGLRDLYFLGTFHSWIDELVVGDRNKISRHTSIVTLVQCSGVVIAPLPGVLMDRNKQKRVDGTMDLYEDLQDSVLVLTLPCVISVLLSVLVILPIEHIQYVSYLCLIAMRAFTYASAGAFIPTAFPTKHYATMLGIMLAAASVLSLVQYPMFLLVEGPLHGNHFYLNVALIAMCLLTFVFPLYVYIYVNRRKGDHKPLHLTC